MSLTLTKKAETFLSPDLDRFWAQFAYDAAKLAQKYPFLKAERTIRSDNSTTLWTVKGDYQGVKAFCDMAVDGAAKLGFKGSRGAAVQWFLDELRGEHMVRAPRVDKHAKDDTLSIATLPDGTKQAFRGRQRVAY